MSVDSDRRATNISSGVFKLLPSVSLWALKEAVTYAKWASSWSLPSCTSVNIHLPTCSFWLYLSIWVPVCVSEIWLTDEYLSGSVHPRSFPGIMNGICSNELKFEHLSDTIQIVSNLGYFARITSSCAESPVIDSSNDWLDDCEYTRSTKCCCMTPSWTKFSMPPCNDIPFSPMTCPCWALFKRIWDS